MTDMRRARLMQRAYRDHSEIETEGSRHALSPSSSDANTWFYPSWKVIVSAYMANTLAGLSRARLFFVSVIPGCAASAQSRNPGSRTALDSGFARKARRGMTRRNHNFVRSNPV